MILARNGKYSCINCDLLVTIHNIYHETPEYYKVKYKLTNKNNGIFYQIKSGKLLKERIKHWYKHTENT